MRRGINLSFLALIVRGHGGDRALLATRLTEADRDGQGLTVEEAL